MQVEAFLEKNPGVFDRFSIIGHSLGGIYPKYMLMLRHTCKAFLQLAPMNFVSLATPHLGSRRTRYCSAYRLLLIPLARHGLVATVTFTGGSEAKEQKLSVPKIDLQVRAPLINHFDFIFPAGKNF